MSIADAKTDAKRGTRLAIMIVESTVGAAALVTGLLFILRPNGSIIGISTSTLSATPFSDFTAPGVLLVFVVGGWTLLAAYSVARRTRNAAEVVLVSGVMLVIFELVEEALIGFNPQRPLIVLIGLALIALSLRLAGPMVAAEVELAGGNLVVRFPGASALLAFKKPLEVPLTHVVGAECVGADTSGRGRGFLSLGTWLPGVITAGRAHRHGGRVFWNVSNPDRAIEIFLRGERYSRLIVDVTDPDQVIAVIHQGIAGQAHGAA